MNHMNNDFFAKVTYPQKIAISALIFAAAIFGAVYWLIAPAVAMVEATKIQMADQSLQAEKDYSEGQNLKKLTDNIKTIEPRIGELEQIFISKGDSLSFITSLETAATKNKVSEKANLNGETPINDFYSQIPLSLDVQGTFDGIVGFISDLETQPKIININSLIINSADSELAAKNSTTTAQKVLLGHISATTYWSN